MSERLYYCLRELGACQFDPFCALLLRNTDGAAAAPIGGSGIA
jgi:hypothetical protein